MNRHERQLAQLRETLVTHVTDCECCDAKQNLAFIPMKQWKRSKAKKLRQVQSDKNEERISTVGANQINNTIVSSNFIRRHSLFSC